MSDKENQDVISDEVGAQLSKLQKARREAYKELFANPTDEIAANKIQGIQKEIELLLMVDSAD